MSIEDVSTIPGDDQSGEAVILVVDDNPLIVDVLRGLLRSVNYHVFTSHNGKEALSILENKRVDVIICDVMMPKMGGFELHEAVRRNPELAHIPFVFLSALDGQADVQQGKEVGADDYLCKPFEPRDLLAVVKGKVARSHNLRTVSARKYDMYRRRVIHTLSHEFRTPLVAINTGMELLLDQCNEAQTPKTKNLLDAVRRGGLRLEKLVNDFMLLQQIDAGLARRQFESKAQRIRAAEIVNSYTRSKQEHYQALNARITVVDQSDDARIFVAEQQIYDCLDRLVSNAVKFSQGDKDVEIHLYRVEKDLCIDVKDRGIGLDPDKLDEAIDVFGQINRDRLEQQGGGLGLPIATHYIAINGGRVEFEPRQGGGSIVSIVIPIAAPASDLPKA